MIFGCASYISGNYPQCLSMCLPFWMKTTVLKWIISYFCKILKKGNKNKTQLYYSLFFFICLLIYRLILSLILIHQLTYLFMCHCDCFSPVFHSWSCWETSCRGLRTPDHRSDPEHCPVLHLGSQRHPPRPQRLVAGQPRECSDPREGWLTAGHWGSHPVVQQKVVVTGKWMDISTEQTVGILMVKSTSENGIIRKSYGAYGGHDYISGWMYHRANSGLMIIIMSKSGQHRTVG